MLRTVLQERGEDCNVRDLWLEDKSADVSCWHSTTYYRTLPFLTFLEMVLCHYPDTELPIRAHFVLLVAKKCSKTDFLEKAYSACWHTIRRLRAEIYAGLAAWRPEQAVIMQGAAVGISPDKSCRVRISQ